MTFLTITRRYLTLENMCVERDEKKNASKHRYFIAEPFAKTPENI